MSLVDPGALEHVQQTHVDGAMLALAAEEHENPTEEREDGTNRCDGGLNLSGS